MTTEDDMKRTSIAIHPSVISAISETALDENRSFSSQLRYLVNKGLEEYGKKVRGNKIVE